MDFMTRIAAVLSDPTTDAVAHAGMAKLGYPHVDPVIVLRLGEALRVVVRVSHRPGPNTNRFMVLDEHGRPIWTVVLCGLSDVAHALKDDGWHRAEVIAADERTRPAERLRQLNTRWLIESKR